MRTGVARATCDGPSVAFSTETSSCHHQHVPSAVPAPPASGAVARPMIDLGMDVHKDSPTMAVLPTTAHTPTCADLVPKELPALRKWLARVGREATRHSGGASYRHSHSVSSNRVGSGEPTSASSPAACKRCAATAQPARATRDAAMTMRPVSACNSTSPARPACSRSGFGIRTPCELPMETMRDLMARAVA